MNWYRLRLRTAAIMGGINLDQPFDHGGSCPTCGAGARPIPPLRADLARMGRKQLDATAHEELLVASVAVADTFDRLGLLGLRRMPVVGRSTRVDAAQFVWLEVTTTWPPLAQDSRYVTEELCPHCGRAGHFDVYPTGTQLIYDRAPIADTDFARTWEYWGTWKTVTRRGLRPVGGSQAVLVSERARAAIVSLRRRHLTFDPIIVRNAA
jgi:hypothetical protein